MMGYGVTLGYFVTEVRTHEQLLEDKLAEFRALTDNSPFGVVSMDASSTIVYANDGIKQLFGYEPSELEGQSLEVLIPERLRALRNQTVGRYLEHGERTMDWASMEFPALRADGKEIPVEISLGEYTDGNRHLFTGVIRDISERKRAEQRLVTLNKINTAVHDIADTIVTKASRDDILSAACSQLVETESYLHVSMLQRDVRDNSWEVQGQDGVEAVLEPNETSTHSSHPVEQAYQTQDVQLVDQDESDSVVSLPDISGPTTVLVIPIKHKNAFYGVMTVCTDRDDAFYAEEQETLSSLGSLLGHAIASISRERALLADEVIEVCFRIPEAVSSQGLPADLDGTVEFNRAVPLDRERHLLYGTATGEMMTLIETLVNSEAMPHEGPIKTFQTDGEETNFEIQIRESPLLLALSSYGGYISEAKFESDQYYMDLQFPPETDVQRVIQSITDAYPNVVIDTRTRTERDRMSTEEFATILTNRLTEKQQAALEAAYFGGFFDWPKKQSGEEIADSLSVSPSTFHQHLRKAEKKLMDLVFTSPDEGQAM
jgi:PAS domain S-box-containing protein